MHLIFISGSRKAVSSSQYSRATRDCNATQRGQMRTLRECAHMCDGFFFCVWVCYFSCAGKRDIVLRRVGRGRQRRRLFVHGSPFLPQSNNNVAPLCDVWACVALLSNFLSPVSWQTHADALTSGNEKHRAMCTSTRTQHRIARSTANGTEPLSVLWLYRRVTWIAIDNRFQSRHFTISGMDLHNAIYQLYSRSTCDCMNIYIHMASSKNRSEWN